MATKTETIIIDNFSGEITADQIGSLNSGLCPIGLNQSGKAPFANPYSKKGLQFLEAPVAIGGTAPSSVLLHTGRAFYNNPLVYSVDMAGNFYTIVVANVSSPSPDADAITKWTNAIGDTLYYGGSLFYDPGNLVMVVGTDSGLYQSTSWSFGNATSATWANITSGVSWLSGYPRPSCFYLGYLFVGNGNALVQLQYSGSVYIVVNNSILNPTLPSGYVIRNIAISSDGRYLILTASIRTTTNDFNISSGQQPQYQPLDSVVVYWNGTDITYSSYQLFKGLNIVSLASSSSDMIMFGKDMDGMGVFDLSGSRLAALEDVTTPIGSSYASYAPVVYGVDAIGKKFFFNCQVGTYIYICMYDSELGKLYILYQDITAATGSITGGLCIASLHTFSVVSGSWQETARLKLYYFYKNLTSGTSYAYLLHLQNYGGNQGNYNYQTQYQEFPQKIQPVSFRIFCLPTVSNNNFFVRLTDLYGNNIANKQYTYASGTDLTLAQGSLTCIKFGISGKEVSSMSLSIEPISGYTTPVIEKVEIDYISSSNSSQN